MMQSLWGSMLMNARLEPGRVVQARRGDDGGCRGV